MKIIWPSPQHRTLAMVMTAVLILWAGCYVLVVRPRSTEASSERAGMEQLRMRLSKTGWPLRAEELRAALEDLEKRLGGRDGNGGIKGTSAVLIRRSTEMFDPKIRELFGTRTNFIRSVSRLDYQEEFNRLQQKLSSEGVALSPEILKLGEDTSSPYTYQLVLQVWTVGFLTDMLRRHDLTYVTDSTRTTNIAGKTVPAALIEARPMRAYLADGQAKKPYLLEFPVKVTVIGSVDNLLRLLRDCISDDIFLPIRGLQVFTDNPSAEAYRQDGRIGVDRVRAEIECSAFFSLDEPAGKDGGRGGEPSRRATDGALPQGA